jgi:hypothetical protein
MSTEGRYTWEQKIESLVTLAKAAGRFLNTDQGTEGHKATRGHLLAVYAAFCEWRHDEPYAVDEIKALLARYEVSPLTGEVIRSREREQHESYQGIS